MTNQAEAEELLVKLNAAVKATKQSEDETKRSQENTASNARETGKLLLQAKKLHPKVQDFDAYLKRVDGLSLSWAYEMMKLAGGRTTADELRKDARERQQRLRDKKFKTLPKPESGNSVTSRNNPKPETSETSQNNNPPKTKKAGSANSLQEFEYACRLYIPQMNEADLKKAHECFLRTYSKKQQRE